MEIICKRARILPQIGNSLEVVVTNYARNSYPSVPAATGEIARKCSTASGTTFNT